MKSRMFRKDLLAMLRRFTAGKASASEQEFLHAYYDQFDQRAAPDLNEQELEALGRNMKADLMSRVRSSETKPLLFRRYLLPAAAAAAILVLIAGLYLWTPQKSAENAFAHLNPQQGNDVLPGADAAMLTLSDGSQVVLAAGGREITDPAGVRISRKNSGELSYQGVSGAAVGTSYNKIETPKGGQFRLILPDGTKVWLNAASSLRYPAFFDTAHPKARTVELQGEAYFEVAHQTADNGSRLPFKVKSILAGGLSQAVEVLGTHFNISAYPDETFLRTTLLEGSVRISQPHGSSILKPGQQLELNREGASLTEADGAATVAWKDNLFVFSNTSLSEILRQLGRWYNVEPETSEQTDRKRYSGMIGRQVNLSEVLRMLEVTGNVKFTLGHNRKLQVATGNQKK